MPSSVTFVDYCVTKKKHGADVTLVSGEFGRVGRVFLAALQNSKFF